MSLLTGRLLQLHFVLGIYLVYGPMVHTLAGFTRPAGRSAGWAISIRCFCAVNGIQLRCESLCSVTSRGRAPDSAGETMPATVKAVVRSPVWTLLLAQCVPYDDCGVPSASPWNYADSSDRVTFGTFGCRGFPSFCSWRCIKQRLAWGRESLGAKQADKLSRL